MSDTEYSRQYHLPISELIDRLTVTQIKLNTFVGEMDDYKNEIQRLLNDIDLIINEKKLALTADLIQQVIALAQINLHIWQNKDLMQENLEDEKRYLAFLKKAHQMNGVRNQIKNGILVFEGIKDESQIRSNFEVDGLDWHLGAKN
jgi:hypothetical protein